MRPDDLQYIVVNFWQELNALSMVVTVEGIVIVVIPELLNTSFRLTIPSGSSTVSRFSHPLNTFLPIVSMDSGRLTFVRALHPQNVELQISFTPLGISTEVRLEQL